MFSVVYYGPCTSYGFLVQYISDLVGELRNL